MTEPQTTPRRGRRARALSPEEQAALEARAARETGEEPSAAPGVRGAVAAPSSDAPVPTLRKFGRRARIIELSEQPAPDAVGSGSPEAGAAGPGAPGAGGTGAAGTAAEDAAAAGTAPAAENGSAVTITRDHDGVELGELSVTEAPEPRPAPRFDGKVLHRPESSGGRALPWLVWALIAVALVVLVVLLMTGVLGGDASAAALAPLADPTPDHPVLEETAA